MDLSNAEIARLLRSVAAALTLKKANLFQVRAYENAADSIEHSSSEIKDLWEEKRLNEVPGLGPNLQEHLNELFTTGQVKHFNSLLKSFPEIVYKMLDIPGVGPKTALGLANLGVESLEDLEKKLAGGELVKKGFSEKIAEKVLAGLNELSKRDNRLFLPVAMSRAQAILDYLKKCPEVIDADSLGSLRRQVATVGDLDFAVSSGHPQVVADYFVKMPGVSRIIDQGDYKATVMLSDGLQADLLIGKPESYGALLQHFTGGKNHNIALRAYAERHGFSLSEYGVKDIKTGRIVPARTEEALYGLLKMQTPAPEIRENEGEIEASLKHELPRLIELPDLKGDLHIHSDFSLEPSHGPGASSIEAIIQKAQELGYEYVGIADHPPGFTTHAPERIVELINKRSEYIRNLQKKTKSIRVLNGLEVDILGDGKLSVPDEALEELDFCIAGIHSGHRGDQDIITQRILKAIENPQVDIISHPTGRLINRRPSFDADWDTIFKVCVKLKKVLEINASPERMDLREDLVRSARIFGVRFIIGSDAHAVEAMAGLRWGVTVARRGWLGDRDVVNTWNWTKFKKRFNIKL